MDDVRPALDELGYTVGMMAFRDRPRTTPTRMQHGVTRVNCFDCLDRTNVVECKFAFTVLPDMMKELGLPTELSDSLLSHIRNIWCDNGDALSKQYTGTCAMKRDYTRTGVRSRRGVAEDAINGVRRWINNHFLDATKQDAVDLVTCPCEDSCDAITQATEPPGQHSDGRILI